MKKTIRILILCVLGINLNAIAQFVHPGLSHKKSDLDRMKYQVKAKIEPWYSSYLDLCSKSTASYDYVVQGQTGLEVVYRDSPRTNKNIFEADSRAAYYNALRWYIEGDERYAQKAVECLNAWTGLTYVQHNGTAALTSNMVIIMLEAAELIKNTYSGWSASEIQDFKDMLVYPGYSDTTVLPNENTQGTWYWRAYKFDPVRAGNQELCGIRTTMALGVFLDNKKMFDRAIRYITKQPGRLDDIPFPTGPHIRGSEIERNQYRIAYKMTVETTQENFYGNGALTNYVWENGQCQESSRDQGHTSFGLGVLSSIGEIAWNQGFDLWGSTDSRILLGLEYSLRYNVSYVKSFADQLDPWEPTALSGEFIQRDDATLRTHSLSICPFIDTDVTRLTRGTFNKEDTWELPIAHYVGRGFKTKDEVKWIIRARDYSVQENGRYETGPSGGAYVGFGGLSFRRPDGCYGDPINGFDNYSLPEFRMHEVSTPIEAENFDYSPVSGVDRIYHDLSSSNSGG
ncbi:alginate lyase family protein, partial [Algibacter mikhailovii]|uniref:alginate lyase family protein n=1 Tax=Algibacter mikhailovii TaxID=425498 RepID=UPI00249577B2